MITIATADNTETLDLDNLLDGLLAANDLLGQITWSRLSIESARGTYPHAGMEHPVVVADLEACTAAEAFELSTWVHRTTPVPSDHLRLA